MPQDYYIKEYSQLKGHKVVDIVKDGSDPDETVYGLVFDNGTVAWIMSDDEGNGSGTLHIQIIKED